MIIYPPLIGDTIPGFSTDKIVIPFQQNPAVGTNDVKGIRLLIKDFLSSRELATLETKAYDLKNGIATFEEFSWEPVVGQYYKFQIAYDDETNYFAYSSVSIGRCVAGEDTNQIQIFDAMDQEVTNSLGINRGSFKGVFTTSALSEPVYSYRFILADENGVIVQDTAEIPHNIDNDRIELQKAEGDELATKIRISSHNFKIKHEPKDYSRYTLEYKVTTVNGFTVSAKCEVVKAGSLPSGFTGNIQALPQDAKAKENGYIEVKINNNNKYRGTFVLERTSNNKEWNELTRFEITNLSNMDRYIWKDTSIEQGVTYTYGIRQYSGLVYSDRILSQPITAEFEDIFLSDGERQLKIKYNPKVSSFKDIILETKTDTIGSQYPFFFRNNKVKYKEIPISGLISYLMDENEMFLSKNFVVSTEAENEFNRTTDVSAVNFVLERRFKLEVLEWLNNGELKLFRSPAEGNYVVRLMNTSLSPNDTVSRMLHTFSATGYEAANNDLETIMEKELVKFQEVGDTSNELVIMTLDSEWFNNNKPYETSTDVMFTGNKIQNVVWSTPNPSAGTSIWINGVTYYSNPSGVFTTPEGIEFKKIRFSKDNANNGDIVTFMYQPSNDNDKGTDSFVEKIENSEDILITIPPDKTIAEALNGLIINYTYSLRVYKELESEEYNYNLIIKSNSIVGRIDCSDGLVRYYNDLEASAEYEKGDGLAVDLYLNVQKVNQEAV